MNNCRFAPNRFWGILTLILLLGAGAGWAQTSQTWNFTTISDADKALLNADVALETGANWTNNTSDARYYNKFTPAKNDFVALKANGQELDYTKGLAFGRTTGAVAESKIGLSYKTNNKNYIYLGGAGYAIRTPELKAGDKVELEFAGTGTGNRSFTADNATIDNGSTLTSVDKAVTTGSVTVTADGAVTFSTDNGIQVNKLTIIRNSVKPVKDIKSLLTINKKIWNFSEWQYAEGTSQTDYTEDVTIDGLTLHTSTTMKMTLSTSNKTIDGVAYTKRLQTVGQGLSSGRYVKFDVTGPCKISTAFISAKSGEERNLIIAKAAAATDDNVLSNSAATNDIVVVNYDYSGEAATLYIYGSSGINIYFISVEYPAKNLSLNDEEDYTISESTDNINITLNRSFTSGNWSSLVLPFDLSTEQLNEAFGENATVAEFNNIEETAGDMTLKFKTVSCIAANTPFIVRPSKGATSLTFNGVNIVAGEPVVEKNSVKFVGTYVGISENVEDADKKYFLASGSDLAFYNMTYMEGMKSFRAYIDTTEPSANGKTIKFALVDDNVATGLTGIASATLSDGTTYNLAGQRVTTNHKGIVIVNGRKILNK